VLETKATSGGTCNMSNMLVYYCTVSAYYDLFNKGMILIIKKGSYPSKRESIKGLIDLYNNI
jgi:hypothetical protein